MAKVGSLALISRRSSTLDGGERIVCSPEVVSVINSGRYSAIAPASPRPMVAASEVVGVIVLLADELVSIARQAAWRFLRNEMDYGKNLYPTQWTVKKCLGREGSISSF